MDVQEQSILRAIAASSLPGFNASDRQQAYQVLQNLKTYPGRVQICLTWLQRPVHVVQGHDVTIPTKLLSLEILDAFLIVGYSECSETERLSLRRSILQASVASSETDRVLSRKLAHLLKGLVLREFPQRWTTLYDDLFVEVWKTNIPIILECMKLVAEDCTDSDFNAKMSTRRRDDVLKGLNELSSLFLPKFFQLLETNYPKLSTAKATIHSMHLFLIAEQRNTMQPDEQAAYQEQVRIRDASALLLKDTLDMLSRFCSTLPTAWMTNNYVDAFLHFLREPELQVASIDCLEKLIGRGKFGFQAWMRIVKNLPPAFQSANVQFTKEHEYRVSEARIKNETFEDDALTQQLDFHRALSRLLAAVLSSHLAHLSSSKQIQTGRGDDYDSLNTYLQLTTEILKHPSGRILSEQIAMWSGLYRDPQTSKSKLLQMFCGDIMESLMDHMVKIRWEDVENEQHPQWKLMEKSFDDDEDYDDWIAHFRSRSSFLFRLIGKCAPQIAASLLKTRMQNILAAHGQGAPIDHVDASNNQLTTKSTAVREWESISHPMDNALSGIPSWAMSSKPIGHGRKKDSSDRSREEIRIATRSALGELATMLVSWQPTYVWLKFRHATLLDPLKHFWKHEPTSLLQGVEILIKYLGLQDEWRNPGNPSGKMSSEMAALKKKSGVALVAVSKNVPQHLVPYLQQLTDATKSLLSYTGLIPTNQMHLYEFLSCVATAVTDPTDRSNFIANVLSDGIAALESSQVQKCIQSTSSLLDALGVMSASDSPQLLTDPANVDRVQSVYNKFFIPLNRLLSVGRQCNSAARKRSILSGLPIDNPPPPFGEPGQPSIPPDEGPLSLVELRKSDPFVPLWPRILPLVLQVYESVMGVWRPEIQAALLANQYQRYVFAISDDEAFLAQKHDKKSGGVFGEGGTAGSVVAGADRHQQNLVPKWSGWLNEVRNTCFQLLGLLAAQRALYAPEIAPLYPRTVSALVHPLALKSMEHRHMVQFLKHIVEFLLVTCPVSLYKTHLEPFVAPIIEHVRFRLEKTWQPVLSQNNSDACTKALTSADCGKISQIFSRGEDEWFAWYYAHAGVFVGDLDAVTAEAVVEKNRVELSRTFSDVLQSAFALKGDWALVLANIAKQELAQKKNDPSVLKDMSRNQVASHEEIEVNADGTPKLAHQAAIDARKLLRINALCHFLLLESEAVAGSTSLCIIECLEYPDAYTCRRIIKICHRILETVAWNPLYTTLLGQRLFTQAVKNLVTEPKWMVGIEWDMLNVVRDIYARLVLGQCFQTGGKGPGLQQLHQIATDGSCVFEQAKTADTPLQGGGVLARPTDSPSRIIASLPGISEADVRQLNERLRTKRSAKDQKDTIRDLLRVAADNFSTNQQTSNSVFDRAVADESLLHAASRKKVIEDLPDKLITQSQVNKHASKQNEVQQDTSWLFG